MKIAFVVFLGLWISVCGSQKHGHLLEKCCSIGGSLGVDGKDCRRVQFPIPGISNDEIKICQSVVQFCCDRERLHLDCKLGEIFAKTYHHCALDNSTKACSSNAESCCSACLLAQSLTQAQLPCDVPGIEDATLTKVFRGCCSQNSVPDDDFDKDYDEEDPKNLCEMLPGQLCAQICIPTPTSYYCQCRDGYILMEDQKSCQPDKSKAKSVGIPLSAPTKSGAAPVPNPEKPVPLRKVTPYPVPPINKAKCSDGHSCEQECTDGVEGQNCSCRPGYELHPDRMHCIDVNECLDNIHVCDPSLEVCQNEVGGYRCEPRSSDNMRVSTTSATPTLMTTTSVPQNKHCLPGYQLIDNNCVDMDECDSRKYPGTCHEHEECVNTQGSYECRCSLGFHRDGKHGQCDDVNECQMNSHACQAEQRCDNTVGSYVCHRMAGCGTGYTLNAHSGQCEDDDECALSTDNCRFLGGNRGRFQCRNTQGSFRCEPIRCQPGDTNCSQSLCSRGYQEHLQTGVCIDINECITNQHNCHPTTETCVNRRGGFDCKKKPTCPPGYEYSLRGCADVDECAIGTHSCGSNSECRNHGGGYTCLCNSGFQKTNIHHCEDIDECRIYGCPDSAECVNTPGSYRCDCRQGYKQGGPNQCVDENECERQGACDHHCINNYGSYRCSCRNGYFLSPDNRTCSDIDECTRFADQLLCVGKCVNTEGSFECSCPSGYTLGGDDRTCQDIDECIRQPCRGADEVCLNIGGSYACNSIACPTDYVKDVAQKNRCKLTPCHDSVHACRQKPATISYNFITFISNLPIPQAGYLDLFALRGPPISDMEARFDLKFKNVDSPPDVEAASLDNFYLRHPGWGQAVVALRKPIPGPQRIQLQLTADIQRNGIFTGKAVAELNIHVSQYDY